MKKLLALFWEFFKIGLFTFGGGYAMVAVIERTLVEKKNWIGHEEFLDFIAIAESTPGPIAINSATYIGYKIKGFFGSVFATLGVVLPCLRVIFIISLFCDRFLELEFVGYAFKGIQACVAFLILSAGLKMIKHLKKTALNIILIVAVIAAMITLDLLAVDFSTIYFILIGGVLGIIVYLAAYVRQKSAASDNTDAARGDTCGEDKDKAAEDKTVSDTHDAENDKEEEDVR